MVGNIHGFYHQPTKSEGKNAIFVVVDRLTKYTHFIPINTNINAPQLAKVFMKSIYKLHGIPKRIVSDRDPKFIGHFWQELFRIVGVTFNMRSAYHPQTDDQTKIVNKCLEGYLRTYTRDKQGKWTRWLHLAKYWYNTTHHMSAGMSPFKALYGYDPPSIFDLALHESRCPTSRGTLQEMQDIVKSLKDNLSTTRNRMKQMVDKKRVERSFTEGDMIFVRLQPYKQTLLKGKVQAKLQPKYYGPYRVICKIGKVAYALELPKESKLYNIFHVSSLK